MKAADRFVENTFSSGSCGASVRVRTGLVSDIKLEIGAKTIDQWNLSKA